MTANQFVEEVFVAWPGRKEVLVLESICHSQIRTIGNRNCQRNEPWTLIMHWRNVHMNVDSKKKRRSGAGVKRLSLKSELHAQCICAAVAHFRFFFCPIHLRTA